MKLIKAVQPQQVTNDTSIVQEKPEEEEEVAQPPAPSDMQILESIEEPPKVEAAAP